MVERGNGNTGYLMATCEQVSNSEKYLSGSWARRGGRPAVHIPRTRVNPVCDRNMGECAEVRFDDST